MGEAYETIGAHANAIPVVENIQPVSAPETVHRCHPLRRAALLMLTDALGVCASFALAAGGMKLCGFDIHWSTIGQLWPAFAIAMIGFGLAGLYGETSILSDATKCPITEVRRLSLVSSGVYICFFAATLAFGHRDTGLVCWLLLSGWIVSLAALPLLRYAMRAIAGFWGTPVMIIGDDGPAERLTWILQNHREFALSPAALFFEKPKDKPIGAKVPVYMDLDAVESVAQKERIDCLVVTAARGREGHAIETARGYAEYFKRVIIVWEEELFSSVWRAQRNAVALTPLTHHIARSMPLVKVVADWLLALTLGVLLLPVIALIAVLIKLSSKGPVFYSAERIGRDGKRFRIYKFRTMMEDADQVLEEYLSRHPELSHQWSDSFKLKKDPRVTRIGRLLRMTSLDELPQLWNVLKGQMSLVGPRPIVEAEIPYYGDAFERYQRVRPGLSGLWQVSGRNDLTYTERVDLDTYYVENWSFWLDAYILVKTAKVVISCSGAY